MQIVGKNCDGKALLDRSKVAIPIERFVALERQYAADVLAVEEPLEIRLGYGPKNSRRVKSISVTMRTPGFDFELSAGFLLTEGVIRDANDIDRIEYVGGNSDHEEPPNERTDAANRLFEVTQTRLKGSVECVQLCVDVEVNMASLSRNFYTTSSCGVCGKASLSALRTFCPPRARNTVEVDAKILYSLAAALRRAQATFDQTGGLHAVVAISGTCDSYA